eukprot:5348048-Prymnesium_polylepis.1
MSISLEPVRFSRALKISARRVAFLVDALIVGVAGVLPHNRPRSGWARSWRVPMSSSTCCASPSTSATPPNALLDEQLREADDTIAGLTTKGTKDKSQQYELVRLKKAKEDETRGLREANTSLRDSLMTSLVGTMKHVSTPSRKI